MKHFTESTLALASRGDVPFLTRVWVKAHALTCEKCRQRLDAYKADRARVQQAVNDFELPRAIRWDELEAEMFGNIHLAREVNEIGWSMKPAAAPEAWFSWRAAAAVTALSLTVITGWMLGGPGAKLQDSAKAAEVLNGSTVLLRGDSTGIGLVKGDNNSLILRNTAAPSGRFEVGLDGSMRASKVDESSGQVTVSQVYAD